MTTNMSSMNTIYRLLYAAVEQQASDLHVSPRAIALRVAGDLILLDEIPPSAEVITGLLTPEQMTILNQVHSVDMSGDMPGVARYRVNIFQTLEGLSAAFRIIPYAIPTLDDLIAPPIIASLSQLSHGLIVVTGPTGSGKSTTLAAIVNYINMHSAKHVVTIEQPIEFIHPHQRSLVQQREVGQHTQDVVSALSATLRQDPDVIVIGEMRDTASIRLAITAAETGHLVLATLHTNSAPEAVDRIIQSVPAGEQPLMRTILSHVLQGVIAQTLLRKQGGGRIAVYEIMTCNAAIRHLIREHKVAHMASTIQTSQSDGMISKEQYIKQLFGKGML